MVESKFQTIVEIPKYDWATDHSKKNVFIGSCFTENVGNRMHSLKYNVDINPFGILYNPMSVANGIELLLENKTFNTEDLVQHNNLWHSFSHHGKFSSDDPTETLKTINSRIEYSSGYLKQADFLLITFGTAWIYTYNQTNMIVSNCHKMHAKNFNRTRISIEDITTKYDKLLSELKQIIPEIKVIFTVSPIRHWKDGAIENQRSKATLLLAIDKIIGKHDNCAYFPSYEIVMDELRDYRFYSEDMIHVSDVAIKHIWERFENSLISKESRNTSKEIQKLKSAINHKPFNPDTVAHKNFLVKQLSNLKHLEIKYPFIDFKEEHNFFTNQLNKT